MAVSEIQSSFNSGELSPSLYSRVDLTKFESGAALIRNFIVNYQGGVQFRPGFQFTVAAKAVDDPAGPAPRVVAFIVGTDSAYVLEFGDAYIRYIQDGVQLEASPAVAYETTTPYALADVADLKFTQSADVMTITHPDYPPANLSRLTASTFAYAAISIGPTLQPPTLTDCTATDGGNYFYGYVVTAVSLDGKEESLASNIGVDTSEILDETDNNVVRLHWTAPSQATINYNIYKWGPIEKSTDPASAWGLIGTARTTSFVDNNIAPDFSKPPPLWGDPFSGGQFESITVAGGGTGYTQGDDGWSHIPYVPLAIMGDGTGAAGYAAIQAASGTVTGVWLTNSGKNYTTATIAANGEGGTGATFAATFSSSTPLNPRCAAYFQQRQVFAGSDLKPETLVFSQTGKYTNFNTTPISLDTDAIVVSIASQEVNTVLSMVPGSAGLLVFTTGGTFLVNGGGPGDPLTPASVSSTSQSFVGATALQPLRINYDVLYTERGNHVRDIAFNWQRQAYIGADISALAAHLFDGYIITDWAYAEQPFKVVWAVRDDGRLLSCTYVPDQEVFAWARHDTQGAIKSVCVVPDGDVSRLYAVIQRHLPDADPCWVNYIERLADKADCCIYDAFHLDSALSLPLSTSEYPLYVTGPATVVDAIVDLSVTDPCSEAPTETVLRNWATDNAYFSSTDDAQCNGFARVDFTIPAEFVEGDDLVLTVEARAFPSGGAMPATFTAYVSLDAQSIDGDPVFSGPFSGSGKSYAVGSVLTTWQGGTEDVTEEWVSIPLLLTYESRIGGALPDVSGESARGWYQRVYNSGSPPDDPWTPSRTITLGLQLWFNSDDEDNTSRAGYTAVRSIAWAMSGETGTIDLEDLTTGFNAGALTVPWNVNYAPFNAAAPVTTGARTLAAVYQDAYLDAISPVFPASVGDVIQVGCGKIEVVDREAPGAQGRIIAPLDIALPGDSNANQIVGAGEWTYVTPVSTITGLNHLEGKGVWALADGLVEGPFTVTDGEVELAAAASSVVVGLSYWGQIKTLYLTAEGISTGTIQGKRKFAPAVTLRLDCTRGLYAGHTFDSLTPVQNTIPRGGSVTLFSGDARHLMGGTWDKKGEVCIEQRSPLPANITGVILEVVPGDTGR